MTVENTINEVNLVGMARRNYSDIRYIVLHHSGTHEGNVKIFREYHMQKLGFADVGYHFVIGNGNGAGDGEIQEGRHLLFTGAHAPGRNEDSVGICLVGDFTQSKPTSAQMLALYGLIKNLMRDYKITPDRVLAHNEVNKTDCPGCLYVSVIRDMLNKLPNPKVRIGNIEIDGLMIDGKVYVHVRELMEALNAALSFKVDWDEGTHTAHITRGGL